ncbi:hypothetical protein EFU34_13210 [Vibrio cholerae]|nr:hypothetical protein [Vibrio cholerae]BCN17421.1 putative acyltransferase [Vibrio cholerae]BCN21608.1 putative acyltransferase [Vibrio cholerae]GHZ65017.1 serine acetyltransferase [Vibrio cholerae]GHZ73011.1 serine acetyltransferase [Vibrio cholerae]
MKLFNIIRMDLSTNRDSGFLCKCIFISYRIGKHTKNKIVRKFISIFHCFLSMLSNCSIPYSCQIGERVLFKHGFRGVFLSSGCIVGDECIILHNVTIGSKYLDKKSSPNISEKVLIGAGAVIVGDINIGKNSKIAPNSFVDFDVDNNTLIIPVVNKIVKMDNNESKYQQ